MYIICGGTLLVHVHNYVVGLCVHVQVMHVVGRTCDLCPCAGHACDGTHM